MKQRKHLLIQVDLGENSFFEAKRAVCHYIHIQPRIRVLFSPHWSKESIHDRNSISFLIFGLRCLKYPPSAFADYHLQSQFGRWNSDTGHWVYDARTSPALDAGDPNSPIGLEPLPHGNRINLGAYGGSPEASHSFSHLF